MNKIKATKIILKYAPKLEAELSPTGDGIQHELFTPYYTLTHETPKYEGYTLYQVKYTDGKLGEWIDSVNAFTGHAEVLDKAKVYGDAVLEVNAIVSGKAIIYGKSVNLGNAEVQDDSFVDGMARIKDNAIVSGRSHIYTSNISGYVRVVDSKIDNTTRFCPSQ